jgi:cytochrome c
MNCSGLRKWKLHLLVIISVLVLGILFGAFFGHPPVQAQSDKKTRISGQMEAADNGLLAGVIMIEKGRLYGKNYQYGGTVDENGKFSVAVDEGGSYGLHLYATGYIYHPIGVEVKSGVDNTFSFKLPPNKAVKEAPVISQVQFEPEPGKSDSILFKVTVSDPNNDLSHQVLAANVRTQEAFILSPPSFVFPWTRIYPNGVYTMTYKTGGAPFDPKEWVLVAADNRCYNSPVLRHPFTEKGVVPAKAAAAAPPSTPPKTEAAEKGSLVAQGHQIFQDNCSPCHHPDSTKRKIGPGLKGLFQRQLTPARRVPVTEANIKKQIQQGGEVMPPYDHIFGDTLNALIGYLKSL